jgi:hypothetical protein
MIEYLPLAITYLKTAKDIASVLLEIRDLDKIASNVIELKDCIIKAYDHIIAEREQAFVLQKRISDIEKENERLKDWSVEKHQYARKPVAMGIFAYMAKDFKGHPQNEYKLCCGCFEKNMKAPLQQSTQGRMMSLVCPNGCPPILFEYYIAIT